MRRVVHIVWSEATGPIAVYTNPEHAWMHARTMVGVDVAHCEVSSRVPTSVLDDIACEYDGEDEQVTPVDGIPVALDDIDDSRP